MTQSAKSYGMLNDIFFLYGLLLWKSYLSCIRKHKISELRFRPIGRITCSIFYSISRDHAIEELYIDGDGIVGLVGVFYTDRKLVPCFGNQIQLFIRLIVIAEFHFYHTEQIGLRGNFG